MSWNHEQFEEWRGSPVTKKFFKYMSDMREELKETWALGNVMSVEDTAKAFVYGRILDMDYEIDIATFYTTEEEDTEDDDDDEAV